MKVVLINTHTYGGAAVVAKRLHTALLDLKIESLLVTKFGIPNKIPKHVYAKNETLRDFFRKAATNSLILPTINFIQRFISHPNLKGRPKGFEKFSPLFHDDTSIVGFNEIEHADIIHLHWVCDFIDYESFFKKFSNKKFVWTLHDMNPITGGCHHSDGCKNFESVCSQCPQLKDTIDQNYSVTIQESKAKGLQYLKDDQLVIASPSVWLSELSKRSSIMKRFQHVVVPNPAFKLQTFFHDKSISKERLGLPLNKKIIVFASENLNNTRKGIGLLFEAIHFLPEKKDIVLIGIGQKGPSLPELEIIYTGRISNVEVFASYLQAADIFVTPTVAENSPLVVIESLCCGTPIVASNVGGIPDLIDDTNGILFPTGDVEALAKAISQALFVRKFDHKRISENAVAIHRLSKIANEYLKVYHSLH